ncbi:hypothetical protein [Acidithiobacillus thiooxidans]|uniref:Uncharacterized protein n=1 Tax=Acidithiobacillus thiooxidans TaxID=930 RepID=A0A1C2I778_ACITH|nr:hypothetical protein [Acidithiobacillus thiooxidans]OCX71855.1 hypothetical protein A6M23_11050 [Acidithiobacillus thiooxidans]OCX87354.1 hypothetical protein A6P08_03460 [Acidithiobacillus thiooxidans]
MNNALLRLFGSNAEAVAKSVSATGASITTTGGKFTYVPVSACRYSWLHVARIYCCRSLGGKSELQPWWRYPQARWGRVSPQLRALARSQAGLHQEFHLLDGTHLFYARLLRHNRRLIAEMELQPSAVAKLPWSEIRALLTRVIELVPFIPPLEAEDRQLARLLLQGRRGAQLAHLLQWPASKIRSRMARLCRLFGVQSYGELVDCLWQAHQRKKFL